MSRSAAYNAIEAILNSLKTELGDDLLAVYLYGSLSDGTYQEDQSNVNLIAVVESRASIHRVRKALQEECWPRYGDVLKHAPLVATPQTLARHLALNPLLLAHFSRAGQLLCGDHVPLNDDVATSEGELLANAAAQATLATAALAPSLLPAKEAQETLSSLRSLARRLFGWPVDVDESSAVLAGRVIGHLRKRIIEESLDDWVDQPTPNAPPLIDDLRAIYERDYHLLLVMPDLVPVELARRIASTDWAQVADRVTDQYRGLWVTTPSLLRLIVTYEDSASYLVDSYHHAWGADPLADMQIPLAKALRGLARLPSGLEVVDLPHAYVIAEDADLSMLIHDFQNKLLNIQLRSELLCRTLNIPATTPGTPLPEQDAPATVRIDAILEHLHWWADHYATLVQHNNAGPEQ
ncbi:MAG: hypothetical protein PVH18_05775 [Chloroflexota bacterium]|jgi:hypothetical protein